MNYCESQKVGRRWFQVEVYEDVNKVPSPDPRKQDKLVGKVEASYSRVGMRWDQKQGKYLTERLEWKLTGKGARKYRDQIIKHLEERYIV